MSRTDQIQTSIRTVPALVVPSSEAMGPRVRPPDCSRRAKRTTMRTISRPEGTPPDWGNISDLSPNVVSHNGNRAFQLCPAHLRKQLGTA
ncbi:hypothetical protein GCM10010446_03090 [Streptomyces enissocaesilis]|uniref:Uncharacterized protein n=1 Tax=Streptomyces enissocaesilis TaxID=332589 RepID=A0ABN3WQS3_9ACTN